MSENVKIDIRETDKTTGGGVGFSSSDVAFVLGLARSYVAKATTTGSGASAVTTIADVIYEFDKTPGHPYELVTGQTTKYKRVITKNQPVLCTTVKEFEETFGYPYVYQASDVTAFGNAGLTVAEGEIDLSYTYAIELIKAGIPVVYCPVNSANDIYAAESADTNGRDLIFSALSDRNEYSVKYITSGGYPAVITKTGTTSSVLASDMIEAAATRGDAVALIDYMNDESSTHTAIYTAIESAISETNAEFGAMMYPWGEYTISDGSVVKMPASFGYLLAVAKAIKTSPNWLAMAGVARGVVPNLNSLCNPSHPLTNMIAEDFQPKKGTADKDLSINCITNIRPYGLTIWGNRTLKRVPATGCTATNFLNIRNMVSDIKKVLYSTAKALMFEQNTETLWLRFKSGVSPLLEQLVTGGGISDYKIIRSDVNNDGNKLQRGEVAAVIKIFPIDAVEYFELMVEISDSDVTIA